MRTLAFALLLLPLSALAQPAPSDRLVVPMPRTITVSGQETVEAPPDRAIVQFAVVTEGGTDAQALLAEHERQVQAALTAVRAFGIADAQIRIQALSLNERYTYVEGRENVRDGYTAYRSVAVTTDELRRVPELVTAVVASGANRLEGLQYTLREPERYENEALDGAVARAWTKAGRIATAAGARLGRVVAVQEAGTQAPMPLYRMEAAMNVAPPPPPSGGSYSAGAIGITGAVVVTFELE